MVRELPASLVVNCEPKTPPFRCFSSLIAQFGTPEVADQMGDAVSKSGAAVEERCVQVNNSKRCC
jgi:hypothetical protein